MFEEVSSGLEDMRKKDPPLTSRDETYHAWDENILDEINCRLDTEENRWIHLKTQR